MFLKVCAVYSDGREREVIVPKDFKYCIEDFLYEDDSPAEVDIYVCDGVNQELFVWK